MSIKIFKTYLAVITLLFISANTVISQTLDSIPITFPDSTIFKLDIGENEYKERLYLKYYRKFTFKNRLSDFIQLSVEDKLKWNNSNNLYDIYYKESNYLKQVASACLPASFNNRVKYQVSITKDASMNAFTLEDSVIYTNIGLIANLKNEAELASVFAHEIGHVNKQHSSKRYRKFRNLVVWSVFFQITRTYHLGVKYLLFGKFFHHLRKQEKQSDDYVVESFSNNKYSTKSILNVEKTFTELEKKESKKINVKRYSDLYRTHPKSSKRYKRLKKQVDRINPNSRQDYLIDSIYFNKLRRTAIYESIFLNYRSSNYSDCIEDSYLQYLTNPKDEFYKLMLYKSIKRKLSLEPSLADKRFITSNYKLKGKTIDESLDFIYGSRLDSTLANKKLNLLSWNDALHYFYSECTNSSDLLKFIVSENSEINPTVPNSKTKLERYFINQKTAENHSVDNARIPIYFNSIYLKRNLGKTITENTSSGSEMSDVIYNYLKNVNSVEKAKLDSTFHFLIKDSLNNYDQEMLQPKLDELSYKFLNSQFKELTDKRTRKFIFRKNNKHRSVSVNLKEEFPDLYLYSAKQKTNYLILLDVVLPYTKHYTNGGTIERYKFGVNCLIIDIKNNIILPKIYRTDFKFASSPECSIILEDFFNQLQKMIKESKNYRN